MQPPKKMRILAAEIALEKEQKAAAKATREAAEAPKRAQHDTAIAAKKAGKEEKTATKEAEKQKLKAEKAAEKDKSKTTAQRLLESQRLATNKAKITKPKDLLLAREVLQVRREQRRRGSPESSAKDVSLLLSSRSMSSGACIRRTNALWHTTRPESLNL